MKKRNLYKYIVLCFLGLLLIVGAVRGVKWYQKEKSTYGFAVTSQTDWTQRDISELKKLQGIQKFQPVDTVNATIKLEGYMLETQIKGVNLKEYPLKWQKAGETYELGNTPLLFMGKDCFASFSDDSGNGPGESEIRAWMENLQELEATLTDEKGNVQNARIGGILKSPSGAVCMEQGQMEEVWGRQVQVTEGYVEIYGWSNMEHAREVLEGAGISCGEGE